MAQDLSLEKSTFQFAVECVKLEVGHGYEDQNSQNVSRKRVQLEMATRISKRDRVRKLNLPQREMWQDEVPVAPAYYVGHQKGTHRMDDFDLYNLTQEIPGYVQPKNSS